MTPQQGILFLDNVFHIDQIKALKPPDSWLVIATSYKRLNLIGVINREVQPLDVESSQEFLVAYSLRLKSNGREITKLIWGPPLGS